MKQLLHLSDCHLFADKTRTGYGGVAPYTSLKQVLAHCFSASSLDVAAVLVTGDISGDDSLVSYHHFKALVAQYVDKPVYVIGGNHDNNPHFDTQLAPFILHAGLSIDIGSWHIHGLDTRYHGTRGKIDKEQLARIKRDLEHTNTTTRSYHLLAMHHHLLPSDSWMDNHDIINPDVIFTWLTATPSIKGIVHGHVHSPLRREIHSDSVIPLFGAPASCWQWEMSADFAVSHKLPGYQIVSLHNDGTMSCEVRRILSL